MAFLSPLHFPPLPFSSSSLRSLPPPLPSPEYPITTLSLLAFSSASALGSLAFRPRKHFLSFTACKPSLMMHALSFAHPLNGTGQLAVCAAIAETNQPKWWEKNAPNMIDIHSTQEFLDALGQAGDRLVIVEFYGTWCASCRALYPKICRTAEEHLDILFLKVNFDENKPMCKSLNVKVLPYFHFYRGADGLLESFSCSLAKFQKIKDAIETHNTARCSLGPPKGISDLVVEPSFAPNNRPAESS